MSEDGMADRGLAPGLRLSRGEIEAAERSGALDAASARALKKLMLAETILSSPGLADALGATAAKLVEEAGGTFAALLEGGGISATARDLLETGIEALEALGPAGRVGAGLAALVGLLEEAAGGGGDGGTLTPLPLDIAPSAEAPTGRVAEVLGTTLAELFESRSAPPPLGFAAPDGRIGAPGDGPSSFAEETPAAVAEIRSARGPVIVGDEVVVDLVARGGDGAALLAALSGIGLDGLTAFGPAVSGLVPIDRLGDIAELPELSFGEPATPIASAGAAENQADQALRADLARLLAPIGEFDGTGITIGILSDSFDAEAFSDPDILPEDTQYAADVAAGELPPGIEVLSDFAGGSDEGRAMAQLIHDIAPGAELLFHTAFAGVADFADGILELAAAGADIIVDDVFYTSEAVYQDDIIAQAVDEVFDQGVAFFSAAGNFARKAYESAFLPLGAGTINGDPITLHDWNPDAGFDFFNDFTLGFGETITLSLHWDEPSARASGASGNSASTDLAVGIVNAAANTLYAASTQVNVGGNAYDFLSFQNSFALTGSENLALIVYSEDGSLTPPPSVFKLTELDLADFAPQWDTDTGASQGHSSAEGALSVGAAHWLATPDANRVPGGFASVDPAVLQSFSSAGGSPIWFEPDGTRLPAPDFRARVDVTGADGGETSFFGTGDGIDPSLSPNFEPTTFPNFFGTSAAAPSVAALAAILLEAAPEAGPQDIYDALISTADDIVAREASGPYDSAPLGFDEDSGAGLVQGDAALDALIAGQPATITLDDDLIAEGGGSVTGTLTRTTAGESTDLTVALGSSDPTTATVPATVTIPAGSPSAPFTVTILDDGVLEANVLVEITATVGAKAPRIATLTVLDDDAPGPTPGNDDLAGDDGPNAIDLLAGDDIYDAGGGNDIVTAGPGADLVYGRAGQDEFILGAQDGIQDGSIRAANLNLTRTDGLFFAAQIKGLGRTDDIFIGGGGTDMVTGTELSDVLAYQSFDPNVAGGDIGVERLRSIETFDLRGGDDVLNLVTTSDFAPGVYRWGVTVDAGAGDDIVFGGARADVLEGGAGADLLEGGTGNDVLSANGGILGGDGAIDFFAIGDIPDAGDDIITDFEPGEDRIFIVGFRIGDFASLPIAPDPVTGDAVLTLEDAIDARTATLTLEGIAPGDLSAPDFLFWF